MIRNLPIDLSRLALVAATPAPIPVAVWAELSDGSRRPVPGQQGKTEEGHAAGPGVPLWTVDALVAGDAAEGRAEVVSVQVASHEPPAIAQFQPLAFEGLVARVTKAKNGDLRMYWSATGVSKPGGGRPGKPEGQ